MSTQESPESLKGSFIWIWRNNRLEVMDAAHDWGKSEYGGNTTHGDQWGPASDVNFKGRYDGDKNVITISEPYYTMIAPRMPSALMRSLVRRFGGEAPIYFYPLNGAGYKIA